ETLINDSVQTQAKLIDARRSNFNLKENSVLIENEPMDELPRQKAGNDMLRAFNANLKCAVAAKETVQNELRQKLEDVKILQKENQSLKYEKEKMLSLYSGSKTNAVKLENQIANLKAQLQAREAENKGLKNELDQCKRELKNATVSGNNYELRLSRAAEEVNKLKLTLTQYKEEEKDLKASFKKQHSELTLALKLLEKQKDELLSGFKKQMQLIKLLRDQKVHLEALRIGEMSDVEYLKILDWKFTQRQ
ncbi:hypothetical protein HUJ05_007486, partial [Dendroctonus ponderosae]